MLRIQIITIKQTHYRPKNFAALLFLSILLLGCSGNQTAPLPSASNTEVLISPSPSQTSVTISIPPTLTSEPGIIDELDYFPNATYTVDYFPTPATPRARKSVTQVVPIVTPVSGVLQELDFMPGAGGVDCPEEIINDPNTRYPATSALHRNGMIASNESQVICLYGVPVGEEFHIELIGFDGSRLAGGKFIILSEDIYGSGWPKLQAYWLDSPVGPVVVGDGNPEEDLPEIVGIDIAWPIGLPDQGTLQVYSDTFFHESGFTSPSSDEAVWLSVIPTGIPHETSYFIQNGCLEISGGEQINFTGEGFPPSSQVPIGLYYFIFNQGGIPGRLTASGILQADANGIINGYVGTESTDPAGIYYIIAVLNPDGIHAVYDQVGPIACFQVRNE